MHKVEEHIFCDGCGKHLGKDDDRLSFFKCHEWAMFKFFKDNFNLNHNSYDFCRECSKKVDKALKDICKNKEE